MTQVAEGGPRVALPIRVHDLLLTLAGRIDDDALADARELLASAELDRSLEFMAGCLAAGRIPIARAQRRELEALFDQANCDPSVVDRLSVNEAVTGMRHRFSSGADGAEQADDGIAEAARGVLDVLPDVRAVWSVWRLTPAGAVSGPVPHRVVLVGVGPGGFAPATAFRVEHALRRAGIRASVEVLRDGAEPTRYHQDAMNHARQVPLGRPAEPGSASSTAEPAPLSRFGERDTGRSSPPAFSIGQPATTPRSVERSSRDTQSMERPRTEPRSVEPRSVEPRMDEQRSGESRSRDQPTGDRPTRSRAERRAIEPPSMRPSGSELDRGSEPSPSSPSSPSQSSPTSTASTWTPSSSERAEPAAAAPTEFNRAAAELDRPATTSQPSPPPPSLASVPPVDFADDTLNEQERDLLRQLQEELVRREQAESAQSGQSGLSTPSGLSGPRPIDPTGRHGTGNPFDWPRPPADPTIVNGVPPKQPDQRRPPSH